MATNNDNEMKHLLAIGGMPELVECCGGKRAAQIAAEVTSGQAVLSHLNSMRMLQNNGRRRNHGYRCNDQV